MSEISDFYDRESINYSAKRYPPLSNTYISFFFKKRLSILLDYFRKNICQYNKKIKLLEVGCGDGILINNLKKEFPDCFSEIIGVDIAPEMVRMANKMNADNKTSFFVRGLEPNNKYDVIMAVGFLSLPMFKEDFPYIDNSLKPGGYFIWSLASKYSLHAKIKLKGKEYLKDYFTFEEYEKFILSKFEIIASEPYGLFIPKLWAFPSLARFFQPIFEYTFKKITPELFHEKIYLLRKIN